MFKFEKLHTFRLLTQGDGGDPGGDRQVQQKGHLQRPEGPEVDRAAHRLQHTRRGDRAHPQGQEALCHEQILRQCQQAVQLSSDPAFVASAGNGGSLAQMTMLYLTSLMYLQRVNIFMPSHRIRAGSLKISRGVTNF